jgi:hypothetical protein
LLGGSGDRRRSPRRFFDVFREAAGKFVHCSRLLVQFDHALADAGAECLREIVKQALLVPFRLFVGRAPLAFEMPPIDRKRAQHLKTAFAILPMSSSRPSKGYL